MRSETEVNRAIEEYADMIQRVCFYHLKNRTDTEDVFQNVFLKYMLSEEAFGDSEHEKAWLLRVEAEITEDNREVLEAVLSLPGKYKDAIYLHYYEGYTAAEIGRILGKKENAVYSLLSRGRKMLREKLGGDWIGK